GRAERTAGPERRGLRLRYGERADRAGWHTGQARQQCRRARILSRADRSRRAQKLPGCEALQAAQTLAILKEWQGMSDYYESFDPYIANHIAYTADHSPAFAARLEAEGLQAQDIQSVEDLARIPILRKDDLIEL